MERKDLHVHTTFSDGRNTPEEMVCAAIDQGLAVIGFSDHSHTAFDESWCMSPDSTVLYRAEIARLKEKYRDRITVLCGIEQDYYSEIPPAGYDYVIGSVHYIKAGEDYIPVDERAEILCAAAERYFGGDIYSLMEEYFRTVADVVRKTNADFIGHFDLVSKFNEQTPIFDERHPRYLDAWRSAADILLKTGVPFEINTGAVSRGYKTVPYPADDIREYIACRGGKFILSGDSHSVYTLCYDFEKYE